MLTIIYKNILELKCLIVQYSHAKLHYKVILKLGILNVNL